MNKDFVLEKDRKRYELLHWIYDEFNRTGNYFVLLDKQIPDGWERSMKREKERELSEISTYLSGEGLVERKNDTGMNVMLTHKGIKEIEDSIRNPQTPTEHFSVPVIQTFYNTFNAPVTGVQQGGQNNAQNISVSQNTDFDKAISSILELIRSSSIPEDEQEEFLSDVQSIKKLALREPTAEGIERAKLRISLLDTALKTTDIAVKVAPFFPQLIAFFENLSK